MHDLVQRHGGEIERELARLDPRYVEKVVDKIDDMLAGGADVAQVLAIALVLDRAEALLDHRLGMPDDGARGRCGSRR